MLPAVPERWIGNVQPVSYWMTHDQQYVHRGEGGEGEEREVRKGREGGEGGGEKRISKFISNIEGIVVFTK
jgi:hypothetical protein